MYADEELKQQLRGEWQTLMEHVMEVNSNLTDRLYGQPLVFDLDAEQDRLKVQIGTRPRSTYTQGLGHVYFDLDIDSDTISALTIRGVSEYMKERTTDHVWMSLLDILRLVRTIEVPPAEGKDSQRGVFARELRRIVFT